MLDLTDAQRHEIRTSWAQVMTSRELAADLFYARLFDTYPETRALFSDDIKAQGAKLTATISVVVDNIEDDLSETVRALGARHKDYNVAEADYEKVAQALVWMLETMTAGQMSDAARAAWVRAYEQLTQLMLEGYAQT